MSGLRIGKHACMEVIVAVASAVDSDWERQNRHKEK